MPDIKAATRLVNAQIMLKDLGNGAFAPVFAGDAAAPIPVIIQTSSAGGLNQAKIMSTAGTNAGVARNATSKLCGYEFSNSSAAFRYVKLYNKATAPTVGTDVPVRTIGVPPGGRVQMTQSLGIAFSAGIAYAITAAAADNDATAIGAADVIGCLDFT